MTDITAHLANIVERIARATEHARRARDSVQIIAISKQQPASAIAEAYAAGVRHFGESYVQEALPKIAALSNRAPPIVWHFIGPIQSNKTRHIAEHFDWVHSVDRVKIAQRLSDARPATVPPLQVLIEVNIGDEASKRGIAPRDALALAREVAALPRLALMC